MAKTQQDLRITRTHRALIQSMFELLEQQSFQKITVNDICRQALVSRSTFYLHFEDKYQLLRYCLEVQRETMRESMEGKSPREFIRTFFEMIKKQESIFRHLFLADVNPELIRMFESLFSPIFHSAMEHRQKLGLAPTGPVPLMVAYHAGGISSMIIHWMEDGFQYTVDEMTQSLFNMLKPDAPECGESE
ncbi:TetR/AcrR family transcriptional regulator [Ruminococcaceae bacterium OttesenSCG-928-L11]|nr:TetR/AcrR family transcriptional regulator [Ruminococcaceae bacterium OttesenSCG-928-L11]